MPAAIAMPSASATGATGRLRAGATCKREPFVRVRVDTTAWMGISATADRLPPGPRFAALQAARFVRGPVAFLESMRRRYGDVFTVPFPFFERLVYLADPESIKQVFKGDPRVFHAGEGNAGPLGPVVGDRSVFVLDEDEHMRERKLLLPPFHGEAVRGYRELMAEIAAREIERWPVGR